MATKNEAGPRPEVSLTSHFLPFMASAPFYGWWVLLALSLFRVIAAGVGNNLPSLLVLPLEEEFSASRAEISLIGTISSISIAVAGPLGGWLMDRFGTRQVMLVCLLLTTLGYLLLSQAQALWQVLALFTIPLGIAYNWAMYNSGASFINNWFDRQKALALSMLNVGNGTGALILPLMALAITSLGWRPAMVISGVTLLIAGLVVVAVVRDTPEEMGLTPDGDEADEAATLPEQVSSAAGATLAQSVRTPFFWAISLGSACMLFVNSSIIFHIVPILGSKGESSSLAATLLSFQLFLLVPIVLLTAWAADRIGGTRVLVVLMVLTVMGVLVLLPAKSLWPYVLANILLAFGGSQWAVLWAVLGRMYGRRHYNSIRMSVYSILIGGMAGAPLLAGLTFDATQSYTRWLQILVGVGVLGVALLIVTVKTELSGRLRLESYALGANA